MAVLSKLNIPLGGMANGYVSALGPKGWRGALTHSRQEVTSDKTSMPIMRLVGPIKAQRSLEVAVGLARLTSLKFVAGSTLRHSMVGVLR